MIDLNALARGVVLAGFEGETFDPALPQFGGYVLFARNASSLPQVRALTDALRSRAFDDGTVPLVAIDQEGGRVVRLRNGVEPMPSMMALGAAGDLELAGRAGEQVAFDLRRAGCTMNFAPVLDLALHAGNTVIGTRSLGSHPENVAALGAAFGAGLERGGIVPCYKHFPGHGATATDSHAELPRVTDDADTLRARDLVPFAAVAPTAPAMHGRARRRGGVRPARSGNGVGSHRQRNSARGVGIRRRASSPIACRCRRSTKAAARSRGRSRHSPQAPMRSSSAAARNSRCRLSSRSSAG